MSGTQAGGSGKEGQYEYMGAFAVLFFLSSERTDAEILFLRFLSYYIFVGHCRPRTFP
jgi:hypothetical protein